MDFSAPAALDPLRIKDALNAAGDASLVIAEGVPADLRLVRKTLRKVEEGKDPSTTLRGYDRNRATFERYVRPVRELY
ncbi:hypothetical protein AABB02_38595 [Streptomyces rimosus]|uniref:hypothetical protein n=1 Tax=Streptomyces rimosus TaxID=1927 RepID=UPI0031CF511E